MEKLIVNTLLCIACNTRIATWLKQIRHEDIELNLYLCDNCVKKSVEELIETQRYKGA